MILNSVKCYKGYSKTKSKLIHEELGVCHELRRVGTRIVEFWTANYQEKDLSGNPVQRKKRFSVTKYGSLARDLAIEFRENKMGKLKRFQNE